MNFIKMVTFSLKRALSVDVWTSYSTSSQYYFPLTAPRIRSPYVKESMVLVEAKVSKPCPKVPKTIPFKRKEHLTVYHDSLLVFDMVLGPLPQPKLYFPLTYGLHILGAVRGK